MWSCRDWTWSSWAPSCAYLDRHATFVLKVTNPGSAPAGNVSVIHQLPQGFKFFTASSGGRHDANTGTVSWFVGDLTPGESREVSVDVVAVNIGEHRSKAVATAARGLRTESETVTRVEGLSALLMELVDTEDPIEVGAETSYEIRVTNTGSKTETNLELVCTIPDKMEFRGAQVQRRLPLPSGRQGDHLRAIAEVGAASRTWSTASLSAAWRPETCVSGHAFAPTDCRNRCCVRKAPRSTATKARSGSAFTHTCLTTPKAWNLKAQGRAAHPGQPALSLLSTLKGSDNRHEIS